MGLQRVAGGYLAVGNKRDKERSDKESLVKALKISKKGIAALTKENEALMRKNEELRAQIAGVEGSAALTYESEGAGQ